MISLISEEFNVYWLYVLASVFIFANWVAHITFRRARWGRFEPQLTQFPLSDIENAADSYTHAHESTLLPVEIGDFAVGRQVEAVNPASVLGHERVVGNPRHRLTAPFQRT